MSAKTRHEKIEGTVGALTLLFVTAIDLIRKESRSPMMVDNLRRALQLFKERRLGAAVAVIDSSAPSDLFRLLNLKCADLPFGRQSRKWIREAGVVYLSELYQFSHSINGSHSYRTFAQEIQGVFNELRLPLRLDLDESGWIPPYMNDDRVLEALSTWMHDVPLSHGRWSEGECEGCVSLGERLQQYRTGKYRLPYSMADGALELGVHNGMFIPASWEAPTNHP